MANLLGVCWDVENWPCYEGDGNWMGATPTPLGGLAGALLSSPAPPRPTPWGIITPLTYWSLIMRDYLAALVIGLALAALALAYFDVLVP